MYTRAVSYTHLDVYKRQEFDILRMSINWAVLLSPNLQIASYLEAKYCLIIELDELPGSTPPSQRNSERKEYPSIRKYINNIT